MAEGLGHELEHGLDEFKASSGLEGSRRNDPPSKATPPHPL